MANEIKEQKVEKNLDEFEFSKQRRIVAMYIGEVESKVVLNETNLTATIQWKWEPLKGKEKKITLDYRNIEKVELQTGFSKSSLIGSAVCVVLAALIRGEGLGVLMLIPFLLFIGFGTNITISCKDKSKVSFMTGKLDGDTRKEFCDILDKKFTALQEVK